MYMYYDKSSKVQNVYNWNNFIFGTIFSNISKSINAYYRDICEAECIIKCHDVMI